MRTLQSSFAVWFAGIALAGASSTVLASEVSFWDIERQPLRKATRAIAVRSDLQIGNLAMNCVDVIVGPLHGSYTAHDALTRLLVGTGFVVRRVNRNTVAISPTATATCDFDMPRLSLVDALNEFHIQTQLQVGYLPRDAGEEGQMVGPLKGRHVVDAAIRKLLRDTGLTPIWVSPWMLDVAEAPKRRTQKQRRAPRPSTPVPPPDLERVLVTGSRLWDFSGGVGAGAAPVTVFDSQRIEELGLSTIGDLLRYLPQQPYVLSEIAHLDGSQNAAIRGLGEEATLVLINGRRTPGTATSTQVNAFDVNTIPLVAVDRVEVLTDSAAAVYGADAIGGVVNIVLKNRMSNSVASARYGAADGEAYERRVSVSGGQASDRFNGSFVLDYYLRDALLGEERDRWRDWDYRRFGASDLRVPQSNPGNVRSLTGENLPGLPSSFAAIRRGTSGIGSVPTNFAAGERNLDSLLRLFSITPSTRRASAVASGELHLFPQMTGFGEFLYTNRNTLNQLNPPRLSNAVVPASNAFNPFGVPVAMSYLFTGIGPRPYETDAELLRLVAGIKGSWKDFDWDLSLVRSDENGLTTFGNNLDPARVADALASSDPEHALNVFQDGPGGSLSLLASLTAPPLILNYAWRVDHVTGFFRGPMFTLPAGTVDAALGVEWRDEKLRVHSTDAVSPGRRVSSAFGELRVPLIKGNLPALRELSLSAAGRFDSYRGLGQAFSPQYGLVWRPLAELALRTSYSKSWDPPSLYELFEPRLEQRGQHLDPRRHNEIATVTVTSGGNPQLGSTRATSFSAGLVYTPADKPMRLSASYWETEITDRVVRAGPDTYLANEEQFTARVLRAPSSAPDLATGMPGALRGIDITVGNFGHLETRGFDVEGWYRVDTRYGQFTPRLAATRVNAFREYLQGTTPIDRVGVADSRGTIPSWRAVGTVAWRRRGMALSGAVRYVSSYQDTNGSGRTTRVVPSQTLIDAQASFTFGDSAASSFLHELTITAGVMSLFNEEPPFSEVNQVYGYDWSQGDLRQRFTYASISKQF